MYMAVFTKGLMAVNLNPSEDGVFLGPPLRWEYDTYKNLKATRLTRAIIDQNLRERERERERGGGGGVGNGEGEGKIQ